MPRKPCYWTRKLELELVEFVHQRDYIWKLTGNTNHHIQQKYKAYADFAARLGRGFTARSVRDRWVNIRSTFNHNLRRVDKSKETAKSPADIYVPCWPLWKPLQFLRDSSKREEFGYDLPNEMLNYTEYHIMGKVSYVRMKPGCLPSKFDCQEDRRKQTRTRPYMIKKQTMATVAECLEENCTPSTSNELQQESCTPSTSIELQENFTPSTSLEQQPQKSSAGIETIGENTPKVFKPTADKSIQVIITHKYRSKATQTNVKTRDQKISPLKLSMTSSSTSPFKVTTCKKSRPSSSTLKKITRNILIPEEQCDSDISLYTPSVPSASTNTSPSVHSLQVKSSSDCSDFIAEDRKIETAETLLRTISKIEKKPRSYIGVPKNCYFLIDIIKDKLDIPKHHVLLCLNKIRIDCTFNILVDDFGTNASSLSKVFTKNVPLIASVLRPFIVPLDKDLIKINLPMAFRHKYHNVSCIIDCLEIEIQKPSKAVNQAMTWSEYKKANTIKYLISCTPNGLVNYVSPGFSGRTTDTCVVESCDFIKSLNSGMCIMADRGFKQGGADADDVPSTSDVADSGEGSWSSSSIRLLKNTGSNWPSSSSKSSISEIFPSCKTFKTSSSLKTAPKVKKNLIKLHNNINKQ